MGRLVEELASSRDERTESIDSLRAAARCELAEHRKTREAVAVQQRRWRIEHLDNLRRETGQLRQATQTALEEMSAAQKAVSAAQQQRLSGHIKALRQDVVESRKMAQAFVLRMDAAHRITASSQRKMLLNARANLSADVRSLREEARDFVGELHQSHQNASAAQREWLAEERVRLTVQVSALRGQFRWEQDQVRADLDKARSIWVELAAPAREMRASSAPAPADSPSEAVAIEAAPAPKAPEIAPVEQEPDDLTVIAGIGPAMQRRLRQAGIETLAQLASSEPEFLRQSVGEIGQLAKVDEWIAEAQRLIETS